VKSGFSVFSFRFPEVTRKKRDQSIWEVCITMNDLATLLKTALITELEELRDVVKKFAEELTEEQLWTKPIEPGNSVGHLILHLTGNLNHFVGAQLGHTGYVRDREREFTEPNPPSTAVALERLDEAVATFRRVVEGLTPAELLAPHPHAAFGPTGQALVHLVAHFALHRGQMSYLTRLVKRG
jgi:uncharacterized damage-inducible protein DinB